MNFENVDMFSYENPFNSSNGDFDMKDSSMRLGYDWGIPDFDQIPKARSLFGGESSLSQMSKK